MGILDGKAAIVTGSGRGIGRATASMLAEHGAAVLINDMDADLAKEAAREVGGHNTVFAGDLTKPDVPERLVQHALDTFGHLEIIVNNAGYTWDGVVHKMTDEQYQAMLDIHLIAPFRIIRAAAGHMRERAKWERKEGIENFRKIVNVSSTSGVMGNPGQANYASGKAGIVGLTKTLAKEWGQFKINVNAVAYGFVETRLTAAMEEQEEVVEKGGQEIELGIPRSVRDTWSHFLPLGRPATTEEAAGGIFFLCSPWSNLVHGQVLMVTGGQFTGMSS